MSVEKVSTSSSRSDNKDTNQRQNPTGSSSAFGVPFGNSTNPQQQSLFHSLLPLGAPLIPSNTSTSLSKDNHSKQSNSGTNNNANSNSNSTHQQKPGFVSLASIELSTENALRSLFSFAKGVPSLSSSSSSSSAQQKTKKNPSPAIERIAHLQAALSSGFFSDEEISAIQSLPSSLTIIRSIDERPYSPQMSAHPSSSSNPFRSPSPNPNNNNNQQQAVLPVVHLVPSFGCALVLEASDDFMNELRHLHKKTSSSSSPIANSAATSAFASAASSGFATGSDDSSAPVPSSVNYDGMYLKICVVYPDGWTKSPLSSSCAAQTDQNDTRSYSTIPTSFQAVSLGEWSVNDWNTIKPKILPLLSFVEKQRGSFTEPKSPGSFIAALRQLLREHTHHYLASEDDSSSNINKHIARELTSSSGAAAATISGGRNGESRSGSGGGGACNLVDRFHGTTDVSFKDDSIAVALSALSFFIGDSPCGAHISWKLALIHQFGAIESNLANIFSCSKVAFQISHLAQLWRFLEQGTMIGAICDTESSKLAFSTFLSALLKAAHDNDVKVLPSWVESFLAKTLPPIMDPANSSDFVQNNLLEPFLLGESSLYVTLDNNNNNNNNNKVNSWKNPPPPSPSFSSSSSSLSSLIEPKEPSLDFSLLVRASNFAKNRQLDLESWKRQTQRSFFKLIQLLAEHYGVKQSTDRNAATRILNEELKLDEISSVVSFFEHSCRNNTDSSFSSSSSSSTTTWSIAGEHHSLRLLFRHTLAHLAFLQLTIRQSQLGFTNINNKRLFGDVLVLDLDTESQLLNSFLSFSPEAHEAMALLDAINKTAISSARRSSAFSSSSSSPKTSAFCIWSPESKNSAWVENLAFIASNNTKVLDIEDLLEHEFQKRIDQDNDLIQRLVKEYHEASAAVDSARADKNDSQQDLYDAKQQATAMYYQEVQQIQQQQQNNTSRNTSIPSLNLQSYDCYASANQRHSNVCSRFRNASDRLQRIGSRTIPLRTRPLPTDRNLRFFYAFVLFMPAFVQEVAHIICAARNLLVSLLESRQAPSSKLHYAEWISEVVPRGAISGESVFVGDLQVSFKGRSQPITISNIMGGMSSDAASHAKWVQAEYSPSSPCTFPACRFLSYCFSSNNALEKMFSDFYAQEEEAKIGNSSAASRLDQDSLLADTRLPDKYFSTRPNLGSCVGERGSVRELLGLLWKDTLTALVDIRSSSSLELSNLTSFLCHHANRCSLASLPVRSVLLQVALLNENDSNFIDTTSSDGMRVMNRLLHFLHDYTPAPSKFVDFVVMSLLGTAMISFLPFCTFEDFLKK